MKFLLNNEQATFNVFQPMKYPKDMHAISVIDIVNKDDLVAPIEVRLRVEAFTVVIMNFEGDDIGDYDEIVNTIKVRGLYTYALKKLDLDLKNIVTLPPRPYIEKRPVLELETFPSHLFYAFLVANNTLLVIILDNKVYVTPLKYPLDVTRY